MRFRACIDEISTLSKIVQTMEKLSKRCIFKMNETTVQIICLGETDVGVQIWSKIPVVRVELALRRDMPRSFDRASIQALRSASAAHDVIVKLAKKNDQPVFSFEAETESRQGKKMMVTHDVRITLHIILPPLKELRTIVEHMQRLSDVLAISATPRGELVLAIQTDDVRVSTNWENCQRPTVEGEAPNPDHENNPDQKYGALVAVKSLIKFLTCHMFSNSTVACSVTDTGGVHLLYTRTTG
ncbi:Hus1-like protein [Rhizoctonia solani]|uniref:Checkpoint protein n=1 Tax=Rhizoctonia solani TaxID=456999 RepID=A0A8H7M4G6_9AGAM|nr:Hus1-like protein [Rhizoctonia solani]